MKKICGVCGNEKRYDDYQGMYRRCDLCNTKHLLNFYSNNKDKKIEKKKNHNHNNKEFFSEQNRKRKNKKFDLEHQNKTITEMIKCITSVD